MSEMEEQWRKHSNTATLSNTLLGGSRSLKEKQTPNPTNPSANFSREYCEYFQEICTCVYAEHPQVWDSWRNLSPVGYAKNMESKMSSFMAFSGRPIHDPSPRHFVAILSLPEQTNLLTMARAETGLSPLKNQGKPPIFGGIQRYFCIFSNSAVILWTALMVLHSKCDPNPGLTHSLPAQLPLDRQQSSLGVKQWCLTVIVH